MKPENVSLGSLLRGGHDASGNAVGHYLSDSGLGFVFDTQAPKPLLRFDGSVEMWALTASQAERGDTVYKNDVGQVMLRLPRIGGMTVYPPHNAKGIAASFDQPADRLTLNRILDRVSLYIVTGPSALVLKRALPNLEGFDVGEGDAPDNKKPEWAGLAVDTSNVVAETINRLAQNPANRKLLDSVTYVRISYGASPSIKLNKGQLLIDIEPVLGIPGRPSSAKIEAALGIH